jgi:hypothetical protein
MTEIDRQSAARSFYQHRQTAGVVAVLMSNQNRREIGNVFSDRSEPFADFPAAETGIDQQPCPPGTNKERITAAAAR